MFVADNVNCNPALADKLGIPHVGCYSHRLNLWVRNYLQPVEILLESVGDVMIKLRTLKCAAKLVKKTRLVAIKRCKTRWSGDFNMLERFLDLKLHINSIVDPELAELMNIIVEVEKKLNVTVEQLVEKYISVVTWFLTLFHHSLD